MSDYIQCCPVCGRTLSYKNIFCSNCGYSKKLNRKRRKELRPLFEKGEVAYMPVELYNSSKPKQYYIDISQTKYNTPDKWKDIFVEEELSKNPLFNKAQYIKTCRKEQEQIKYREEFLHQQESSEGNKSPTQSQPLQLNIPRCPTCNSTNIKKISDLRRGTHAVAWGLFSKTARSQFECKNCGYKF